MMKNISFNQNCTSLAVATVAGFNLYNLSEIDTVLRVSDRGCKEKLKIEQKAKAEDIFMIERHYEDTIVAVVPENRRAKLVLWDFRKCQSFPEKDKRNDILAIKFHRRNVILFLEYEILMHNIDNITFADHHKQHNISPNPKGIHAVAYESKDYGFVAVPYKDDGGANGQVEIFDTVNWRSRGVFTLHSTPVEALAFNPSGTHLASASRSDNSGEEMVTVIRVFSVAMVYVGERVKAATKELFEFRHKYFINESIQSLSFSTCAQFLAANTKGISTYVYSLDDDDTCSKMSKIDVAGPVVVKKLDKDKKFNEDGKVASKICAISNVNGQLRVVIVTSDLCLSVYTIPSSMGDKYTCLGYYDLANDILDDSPDAKPEITLKAKLLGYTIFEASAMYNPPEYDKQYFANKAKRMNEAKSNVVKRAVKFNDEKLECFYTESEVPASTSARAGFDAEEGTAATDAEGGTAATDAASTAISAANTGAQGAVATDVASTSLVPFSSADDAAVTSTSGAVNTDEQGAFNADSVSTSSDAVPTDDAAARAELAAAVSQLREWWNQ